MSDGLTKAKLVFEDKTEIECQFNPSDVAISKSVGWKARPATGRSTPSGAEYVGGSLATFDLSLTFDTTGTGEKVTKTTDKLHTLVEIEESGGADYDQKNRTGRPPWVKFVWGEIAPFKCVCTSLTTTFTYFARNGDPLRATAQIGLRQFDDPEDQKNQNPTSGTPRPARLHTVNAGESLDRIAAKHYGKATNWRLIAEANRKVVSDPMRLRPGTVLAIPDEREASDG